MKLFDRYINQFILIDDLLNEIDFGRYCILDEGGEIRDLTYSNFQTTKPIRQELLLEKNKGLQDIFLQILSKCNSSKEDQFSVIPLIQRITDKLGLNDFEKLVYEKIFHLEEIFRVPHYLLEREIEKVHVSRAKRIPAKSYQYLASHTEDWIHKSIVSFKPSRILNEELELNFDVYENQLTIIFIERCLAYFNSRLKEIQDIKSFHRVYQSLLNKDFSKGWFGKLNRNFKLMGNAYDDENYRAVDGINDQNILSETEKTLNQINKRLLSLRKSDLFELLNKKGTQSISLRNTNVLVNHKHYRYVKSLWIELDKVKPEKVESEKIKFEQDVLNGLRAYGKSIIAYALAKNLNYVLNGNYKKFIGRNPDLSQVVFVDGEKGTLKIEIGDYRINIILIGNVPEPDEKLCSLLLSQNTFIFYYSEQPTNLNSRFIQINPLDPDSVERVGTLIRKYLLWTYLGNINKVYKFKQLLKDFIKYIPTHFLEFDQVGYAYKFHSYPKSKLSYDEIKKALENDSIFKTKGRMDKEIIFQSLFGLLEEIESNVIKFKNDYLKCFNCGEKILSYNIERVNYIKCASCSCLVDSSNSEKVILRIGDSSLNTLTDEEFGIDSLYINKEEMY